MGNKGHRGTNTNSQDSILDAFTIIVRGITEKPCMYLLHVHNVSNPVSFSFICGVIKHILTYDLAFQCNVCYTLNT